MHLSRKSARAAVVESPALQPERDAGVDAWLVLVLRIGVAVTVAILLIGLGLLLAGQRGTDQITRDDALGRGVPIHALTPSAIFDGLAAGSSIAFIQLGLLALILTPVVRVAVTLFYFWRQQDWPFVLFSGIVLAILALGLLGIGA